MRIPAPGSFLLRCLLPVTLFLVLPLAWVRSESDWPHWRGPTGNGVSPDGRPPVEWGETKNLKWKVELPGVGSASPIVAAGRIFIAAAVPVGSVSGEGISRRGDGGGRAGEGRGSRRGRGFRRGRGGGQPPDRVQQFTLLCLDRETGKILWKKTAAEAKPHEGHHPSHGFASASPCTDGELVWAYFGSRGLFCYSLSGKEIWKKTNFGKMQTRRGFGEGSSPTVHGGMVIVPWDHEGPSYLTALDKKTGETLWKTDRDEPSCWATPLVVEHGGRKQVIMNGDTCTRGYDLETGDEIWRCGGQTTRPVASPVAGHGLVFVGSGFRGNFLAAFRLGGKGDLEGTEDVAWSIDKHCPDVPSPLLYGNRLYFHAGRKGILSCFDAVTKKPFFSARRVEGLGEVYSSPVGANGKIYLTGRDGTTVVIEEADEFKIVATNRLDEGVDATPAISGREIFLRGQKHLYCFRQKNTFP